MIRIKMIHILLPASVSNWRITEIRSPEKHYKLPYLTRGETEAQPGSALSSLSGLSPTGPDPVCESQPVATPKHCRPLNGAQSARWAVDSHLGKALVS